MCLRSFLSKNNLGTTTSIWFSLNQREPSLRRWLFYVRCYNIRYEGINEKAKRKK
jgi:hypothetical protein